MLFSISNTFRKLNQRQQNLTHIVLDMMIVFRSALHFLMFSTNFDQRTIRFDTCYVLRVVSKNIFLFFQTFIKNESRTKRFDPYCPFTTLFLTNPLFFYASNIFKKFELGTIWSDPHFPFKKVLIIFLTKELI